MDRFDNESKNILSNGASETLMALTVNSPTPSRQIASSYENG